MPNMVDEHPILCVCVDCVDRRTKRLRTTVDATLLTRLRRHLPYLGIYAADVREAIAEIERLQRANQAMATEIARLQDIGTCTVEDSDA